MIRCLIVAFAAWFSAVCIAVARYFERGDRCPTTFIADDPSVLMVAFVTAFIFSYAAIYRVGRVAGYSEGEWQEKSRFPCFVREDPSGFPCEVRGWVENRVDVAVGETYCWTRSSIVYKYKITAIIEQNHKFKFIVAINEPTQKSFNSRL